MRIGLETSFLDRPSTGIGTYLSGLRRTLIENHPEIEVVDVRPDPDRFTNRLGPRPSRFLWESIGSGLTARRLALDLLHVPLMAVPPMSGVPVVATVHDVIPFVLPEYRSTKAQQINLAIARRSIHRARAIIVPSRHAAGDVNSVLGIPADRVWVTYEAVDERFVPGQPGTQLNPVVASRYGITAPYVFNIGGLDVRKNLPALIEAFATIQSNLDVPYQLVVAGVAHSDNSVVFPPLAPLIAKLGLNGRVILTGRVSEDDKLELMQHAILYVTPSRYEGFGLSALEAMSCGIPLIAANRTSLPEVVGDGGLLVEPDVSSIADAMRTVLTNPSLAAELSDKGLRRATTFSWTRMADETIDVYRLVLALPNRTT